MKIISSLGEIPQHERLAITIGNFDGFHLGHQDLIKNFKNECQRLKCQSVVMTFNPHPQQIINTNHSFRMLYSHEHKIEFLKKSGIDYVVVISFDRDFSTLSPQQFLEKYIFIHSELKAIFLGYDFVFGSNKAGTLEIIQSYVKSVLKNNQLELKRLPEFKVDGTVVSSSRIRDCLQNSQIKKANKFLGRAFSVEGIVTKGDGRGRTIGFPTANISHDPILQLPHGGVYITQTTTSGLVFQSVTNIGSKPTFSDSLQNNIETHIFDFNSMIYGESISVEFLEKIRDEKKFNNVNELIEQIRLDCTVAKNYFHQPN